LLLICVPIFVPIAKVFGWNLIWFGVIITVLDNMASITPPFGISLFFMKEVAGVTLGAMYRSAVPFVIALFVCLLLIVLFPPLATYLPTLMNG
ncbi:TRAP transporter large permease subunit, partial [Bilophila wadsworthia]|uniref:TRAP transporter large permease subunit n=2 Tax=Bilophila wadsworthia TaxID=35833 RepID=UPI00243215DA